jgi:enamine deaminase RidA (YjgF/YER057c/UK114 family)
MSTIKVGVSSPDPILARSSYSESAIARIAHINEAVRLVKADVDAVGVLPASTNLTATSVNTLRAAVEIRLDDIESKLNALILALS